jgi:hypothetical protein
MIRIRSIHQSGGARFPAVPGTCHRPRGHAVPQGPEAPETQAVVAVRPGCSATDAIEGAPCQAAATPMPDGSARRALGSCDSHEHHRHSSVALVHDPPRVGSPSLAHARNGSSKRLMYRPAAKKPSTPRVRRLEAVGLPGASSGDATPLHGRPQGRRGAGTPRLHRHAGFADPPGLPRMAANLVRQRSRVRDEGGGESEEGSGDIPSAHLTQQRPDR